MRLNWDLFRLTLKKWTDRAGKTHAIQLGPACLCLIGSQQWTDRGGREPRDPTRTRFDCTGKQVRQTAPDARATGVPDQTLSPREYRLKGLVQLGSGGRPRMHWTGTESDRASRSV
jgi:hypothetical protein